MPLVIGRFTSKVIGQIRFWFLSVISFLFTRSFLRHFLFFSMTSFFPCVPHAFIPILVMSFSFSTILYVFFGSDISWTTTRRRCYADVFVCKNCVAGPRIRQHEHRQEVDVVQNVKYERINKQDRRISRSVCSLVDRFVHVWAWRVPRSRSWPSSHCLKYTSCRLREYPV
jgi:hypothetical protein